MAQVALDVEIQQSAEGGQSHDDDDPGDLGAVVVAAVEQEQGHDDGEDQVDGVVVGQIVPQHAKADRHQRDLQQQEQQDEACPAEYCPQQAVAAPLQQAQPGILHVVCDDLAHLSTPSALTGLSENAIIL